MNALAKFNDERFTALVSEPDGHVALIRAILPPGPETLWPAVRMLGSKGYFSVHDVAQAANCAPQTAEAYLAKLHAAAMVAHAGETNTRSRLWMLTAKKVLAPFLNGQGNPSHGHEVTLRIWRALKMVKMVSVTTLCNDISDEDFRAPMETVRLYLNALARSGYLDIIPAERACGEQRYRLRPTMHTGPLPPRLMRATLVFDPNRKALAGSTVAAEEVRL
jgi:hypothetical protein